MTKLIPTPKDLTLIEIMQRFDNEDTAREYLEAIRWPNGPVCPHCGNCDPAKVWAIEANAAKKVRPGLRQCAECKKQFTVTVGTIFEDSKVPLHKWLIAWYLLCSSKKGIAALELQRVLGLGSYRTAWFMLHRIRYALKSPEFQERMGGTVEVDETWVGGKKTGKRFQGRKDHRTPVVAMVERGGNVRSRVVARVTGEVVQGIIQDQIRNDATIYTDDSSVYRWPKRSGWKHQSVNHSKKEYVRGDVHTNTVEGYFGNLKRGINGVFHHVSEQHLPLYLAEFEHRYNHRKVSDGERTVEGIKKVDGKRLTLKAPSAKMRKRWE